MQIVDAQIHLWGSGLPSNAAHRQVTSFTVDDVLPLMDAAGVDAAVIHPPSWDPGAEALALAAARDHPGRFAVMGDVALDDPASRARIAGWRDRPGMLGLRYLFLEEPARTWLHDGTTDWLWEAAEAAGVPVAVLATGSEARLAEIARRHPGLRLTVDHLGGKGGNTTLKDHAAMAHMPELLRLADLPNVAVKATGLPGYSAEAYPFPIMQGYFRQVLAAFGPERVFWGTDITKMPCSWAACLRMVTEMEDLGAGDLRLILGGAVRSWWGWS